MSDPFTLVGVMLGVGAVVLQLVVLKGSSLVDAISLILSGIGLLTGIKVCYFAVIYRDVAPIQEISTQVFIGGFAIGWVAVQNGVKKFGL
jgi:hypothetical protein